MKSWTKSKVAKVPNLSSSRIGDNIFVLAFFCTAMKKVIIKAPLDGSVVCITGIIFASCKYESCCFQWKEGGKKDEEKINTNGWTRIVILAMSLTRDGTRKWRTSGDQAGTGKGSRPPVPLALTVFLLISCTSRYYCCAKQPFGISTEHTWIVAQTVTCK